MADQEPRVAGRTIQEWRSRGHFLDSLDSVSLSWQELEGFCDEVERLRDLLDRTPPPEQVDATIERMRQEIHRLKDLGWAQEGEIAVLRKALAAVEWEGNSMHSAYEDGCPSCNLHKKHAPDCQLKAALEERRVP